MSILTCLIGLVFSATEVDAGCRARLIQMLSVPCHDELGFYSLAVRLARVHSMLPYTLFLHQR